MSFVSLKVGPNASLLTLPRVSHTATRLAHAFCCSLLALPFVLLTLPGSLDFSPPFEVTRSSSNRISSSESVSETIRLDVYASGNGKEALVV